MNVGVRLAPFSNDFDIFWERRSIYLLPEFRGKGMAREAISAFMKGKRGRAFIEDENVASQRAYEAAGFILTRRDEKNRGAWWENF